MVSCQRRLWLWFLCKALTSLRGSILNLEDGTITFQRKAEDCMVLQSEAVAWNTLWRERQNYG